MKRPLIFATLILLLVIAGLLYWFISRTLDTVTLVQTLDDVSHEVIRGWAIVPALWPVMLVTAIPVLLGVGGLALRMLSAAVDADWQRELTREQQRADAAEQRADGVEENARARYEERNALAEKRQLEAAQQSYAASIRVKEVNAALEEAKRNVEKIRQQAQAAVNDAQQRLHNASATSERRRRKLEKQKNVSGPSDKTG